MKGPTTHLDSSAVQALGPVLAQSNAAEPFGAAIPMKVYVGQARGLALVNKLARFGWAEMTCRGELPPRRSPWAYDNGAFSDWKAEQPFDADQFLRDLDTMDHMCGLEPDFVVAPDIVAGGLASLDFSFSWMDRLDGRFRVYLAVQDGMRTSDVGDIVRDFDGIFIGGTAEWKKRAAEEWIAWAHGHRRPAHIGRVGSAKKVRWAKMIGADSVDSCLPLWSVGNLEAFRGEVQNPQGLLWRWQLASKAASA